MLKQTTVSLSNSDRTGFFADEVMLILNLINGR